MSQDIRWIHRLQNFEHAFLLLQEVVEGDTDIVALEAIVKEGIIQRFEYTFELAWKTLKDKMIEDGLQVEPVCNSSLLLSRTIDILYLFPFLQYQLRLRHFCRDVDTLRAFRYTYTTISTERWAAIVLFGVQLFLLFDELSR